MLQSIYVVQARVIKISDVPFDFNKNSFRKPFRSIFSDKLCFLNSLNSTIGEWAKFAVPASQPFIKNIGSIGFSQKNNRLNNSDSNYLLIRFLTGHKTFWDEKDTLFQSLPIPTIFGYQPDLEDQRFNHLYYELKSPSKIKAVYQGKEKASGRIFFHLYPSGYLIVLFAFVLSVSDEASSSSDLLKIIKETRPWHTSGVWSWETKQYKGGLYGISEKIKQDLLSSIFINELPFTKSDTWFTGIKLLSEKPSIELAEHILKRSFELMYLDLNSSRSRDKNPHKDYLATSKLGMLVVFSTKQDRKVALRLFWKIMSLYEFVILKSVIYRDYADLLKKETVKLKEYRLSISQKLTYEELYKLSVFEPTIPRYLYTLDEHIQSASPFHRKIYSVLSTGAQFDDLRSSLKEILSSWETEVEKWEPSFAAIWKRIISPIKSLVK